MKIVFNRQDLSATIAPLMCAVSTNVTVPASRGILIEAKLPDECTLTTFDLEKGMRIVTKAKVFEEGSYIISANKLMQTLRVMNGEEITLTVDDKLCAKIMSGKSSHTMNALSGSEFPTLPKLKTETGFEMKQSVLKEMFGQVMYAMGVNDQRNVLNGAYIRVLNDTMTMVACDNFKLAKVEKTTHLENKNSDGEYLHFAIILPVKTVNELYRLLSDDDEKTVRVHLARKNIIFEIGELVFFSRLIEGEYLDYDRIILKTHKYEVCVNREEILSALERASLITEEKIAGSLRSHVKLNFDENLLKITATSSAGSTYDEIDIVPIGEPLSIAFNNRYLINSIRACDAEIVRLSMSSPLSSINIEPSEKKEDTEEIFMLLPIRTKD